MEKQLRCSFCQGIIPEAKAKIRRRDIKKNKNGKVFCNHSCRIGYFFSDKVRHSGSKICHICGVEKPKTEFYFANKEKTRYAVNCKVCSRKQATECNKNNPKRVDVWRRHKYGMEPEDYNLLLQKQGNVCAICYKEVKLCVDHNHSTGKIRGLLCTACNKGLGSFYDNIEFLKNAMEYLQCE